MGVIVGDWRLYGSPAAVHKMKEKKEGKNEEKRGGGVGDCVGVGVLGGGVAPLWLRLARGSASTVEEEEGEERPPHLQSTSTAP